MGPITSLAVLEFRCCGKVQASWLEMVSNLMQWFSKRFPFSAPYFEGWLLEKIFHPLLLCIEVMVRLQIISYWRFWDGLDSGELGRNLVGVDGFPFTSLQAVLGLGGQPSTCQVAPPHNGPLSWDISCGVFSCEGCSNREAFCWEAATWKPTWDESKTFSSVRGIAKLRKTRWILLEVAPGCAVHLPAAGDAASLAEAELQCLKFFLSLANGKQWFLTLVWECLRYRMRDIAGYLTAGTDCKFPQFVDGPNWCGEVENFAVILWCIVWKIWTLQGCNKAKKPLASVPIPKATTTSVPATRLFLGV